MSRIHLSQAWTRVSLLFLKRIWLFCGVSRLFVGNGVGWWVRWISLGRRLPRDAYVRRVELTVTAVCAAIVLMPAIANPYCVGIGTFVMLEALSVDCDGVARAV
jgi:hypothetical protein